MEELKKYFTISRNVTKYGDITLRCIGIVDILTLGDNEFALDLIEHFNPISYFNGFSYLSSKLEKRSGIAVAWASFLAFAEDNVQWKMEHKKELPNSVKPKHFKKLIKWQEAGKGYFTPNYLDNVSSMEELREAYEKSKTLSDNQILRL